MAPLTSIPLGGCFISRRGPPHFDLLVLRHFWKLWGPGPFPLDPHRNFPQSVGSETSITLTMTQIIQKTQLLESTFYISIPAAFPMHP